MAPKADNTAAESKSVARNHLLTSSADFLTARLFRNLKMREETGDSIWDDTFPWDTGNDGELVEKYGSMYAYAGEGGTWFGGSGRHRGPSRCPTVGCKSFILELFTNGPSTHSLSCK